MKTLNRLNVELVLPGVIILKTMFNFPNMRLIDGKSCWTTRINASVCVSRRKLPNHAVINWLMLKWLMFFFISQ